MFEAFNNYADFSGRASRSEYWLLQVFNLIVFLFASIFVVVGGDGGRAIGVGILVLWALVALIPNISVTVRRFHDHNVSGWWALGLYLFGLIPYIGLLASLGMLWVLVRAGTYGANNYGADPVNPWRSSALA